MRRLLLAALLSLPAAAAARPELGLRAGWARASGWASDGVKMSEVARAAIPLQLDALWRFSPTFAAGVYYSYGFGLLSSDVADRCDAQGASCSVWQMRTGLQAAYTFADLSERWAPWIGAQLGYEWIRESASQGGQSGVQHLAGWEWLSLQGGADVLVSRKLSAGPYLTYSVDRYGTLDGSSIVSKGWHQWFGVGLRGTWRL